MSSSDNEEDFYFEGLTRHEYSILEQRCSEELLCLQESEYFLEKALPTVLSKIVLDYGFPPDVMFIG